MPSQKTADQWFAEYGESHQNDTNELIHWICVPVIFFCVLGLLWSLPVPASARAGMPDFTWALPAAALAIMFYIRLSLPLALGLIAFIFACLFGLRALAAHAPWPVWQICLVLFVLAWIGQFVGHKIEGKKPSFFKDVQFLLIGPAWLLSLLYKKLGLRY